MWTGALVLESPPAVRDVRPYPFAWLPRWTHAEASLIRALLRRLLPAAQPSPRRDVFGPRWHALLGEPADAWPLTPFLATPAVLRARYEGDTLAPVMRHRALGTLAALIDAPFALTLAARALGADAEGARRTGATRTFTAAHEGALALLCGQAAALAFAPSPPPTIRAVTDRVADVTDAIGSDALVVWPWRVTVGLDAGDVALVLDARALTLAHAAGRDRLDAFGELALRAELVAGRGMLTATDVAALAPGDLLALEGDLVLKADTGLEGVAIIALGMVELPVTLAAHRIVVANEARIRRNVVVDESDHDASKEGEGSPRGAGQGPALRTELLAALPVEVEVVIAQGSFALAEVGAWRVGEVVAFPSRVGEAVLVRAGSRAVARGELCDVDGEVGVRVTELL